MLHPDLKTIIIMGVSGAGKSVIGSLLAAKLDAVFEDGDDFHPPENKAKMSSGTPLTDDDRWPWYAVLRQRIEDMRHATPIYILACSALKPIYRDKLRAHDAPETLRFVLLDGTREIITARLAGRKGHFMPPSLLDSQLATLDPTPDLIRVPIDGRPEEIVADILQKLA
ncbi:gluconokinase [Prosthecobacter sp.]|uniref:gluconokinase n=1 Tax=Prosthecobacter sp. TaxID=1965333 RepID=UPI0025EB6AF2|nr:gluconokinase [Prosthecobacter sp.]